MAYPHRGKPAAPNTTEVPAEQAQAEKSAEMKTTSNKPLKEAKLEEKLTELDALLSVLHLQLKDNRDADEKLTANLEGWTDLMAECLTENFVMAVKPYLVEQKDQFEKMQISVNSLKEDVNSLKRVRGFKSKLFWLSIICNVGLALYAIGTLVVGKFF